MISHRVKNLFRTTTAFAAMAAASLAMSSCGGGGGGSDEDDSPPTTRVKTMDGITLTLSNTNNFEFTRHAGTPPAALNGSMETGSFTYSRNGNELHYIENSAGSRSNVFFPDTLNGNGGTYTYLGQNDGGGVLILTAKGSTNNTIDGGAPRLYLVPDTDLFIATADGDPSTQLRIDLTFTATGSTVSTGVSSTKMVESSNPFDDLDCATNIFLTAGGSVPVNYNPYIDPLRPSKITPASLQKKLFRFEHGGGDSSKDFTLQFASEVTGTDTVVEVGSAIQRIGGAIGDAPAVNYTWTRIGGSDTGRLVISGGGNTYDGTYTLTFLSSSSGNYLGSLDADTTDISDVTGSFSFN